MSDPWSTEIQAAPPPRKSLSPAGIVALASALLVLAVGGAAIGWTFADDGGDDLQPVGVASPSFAAVTPSVPPSPSPSASSASPSPVASPGAAAALVVGLDFREARAKLAEQGMQAVLKFDDTAAETFKVLGISPPDAKIASGISVTLQISGAAPAIAAADLAGAVGQPCQDAKSSLVKAGLIIDSYAGGVQNGTLLSVSPLLAGLKFNDRVVLTCGVEATPSAVAAP
jgi:hypothetical protein